MFAGRMEAMAGLVEKYSCFTRANSCIKFFVVVAVVVIPSRCKNVNSDSMQ